MKTHKIIKEPEQIRKYERKLIVTYPPDFDGELHIEVIKTIYQYDSDDISYQFKFTRTAKFGETAWETLVKAAKEIIEQDNREIKDLKK